MKQKLKEFKRQLLKNIQAKLRQFLNTDYRTVEEIEQDAMNSYLSQLKQLGKPPKEFLYGDGDVPVINGCVGEMKYMYVKSNGKTYYKNVKSGCWIDVEDGTDVTEEELKELLETQND